VPGPGARHGYRLTEKGRDFFPAFVALKRGGDRWITGPEGPPVVREEAATGQPVVAPPLLSSAGAPLRPEDVRVRFSPGAGEGTRRRLATGRDAAGGEDDHRG
jgi:hypothetical protein